MIKPVLHLSVVAMSAFAMWHDQSFVDLPFPSAGYRDMPYKARYMYMTYWCYMLQTLYFAVALLNDLFGASELAPRKKPLIRYLKDTIFSLAFAMALFVSSSFWSIYYFDKELVFPEVIERNFPVWLNHALHTFITVFMFIELLFTNRNYPSRKIGITLVAIFGIAYSVWLHVLYARHGAWVYPIFAVMNPPQRIVYLAFSVFLGTGFYILGEKLNSFVCPNKSKPAQEAKRKRK